MDKISIKIGSSGFIFHINGSSYSMFDVLQNKSVIETIHMNGFDTKIFAVGDIIYLTPPPNSLDLTPLYDKFKQGYSYTTFRDKLIYNRDLNPSSSEEKASELDSLFQKMFESFKQLIPYELGELRVNVSIPASYIQENSVSAVARNNTLLSPESTILGNLANESLKMETSYDYIFLKVPTYRDLYRPDLDISSLLPDFWDVFPNMDIALRSPYYRTLYETPSNKFKETLENIYKLLGVNPKKINNNLVLPPIEYVIGNKSNNKTPVEENEIAYYTVLCNLIKYDTERNFSNAEEMLKSGILSERLQQFFEELIENAVIWNYKHTGFVPSSVEVSEDTDKDDSEPKDEDASYVYGKNFFYNVSGLTEFDNVRIFDCIPSVKRYIEKCATGRCFSGKKEPGGSFVYAEAIIKLLRFGERKPTELFLSDKFFPLNLKTFQEKTSEIDLSSLSIKKVNGCEFELEYFILVDKTIEDTEYLNRLDLKVETFSRNVGVVLKTTHTDGVKEYESFTIIGYKSLLEDLDKFVDNIEGLKITNSQILCEFEDVQTLSLAMVKQLLIDRDNFFLYTPSSIERIVDEFGYPNISELDALDLALNSSCFLGNFLEDWRLDSNPETLQYLIEEGVNPVDAILINIADILFKFYKEIGFETGDNDSDLKTLCLNTTTLSSRMSDFLDQKIDRTVVASYVDKMESKMQSFDKDEIENINGELDISSLLGVAGKDLPAIKLMSDAKHIGYLFQNKNPKIFYLASLDEVSSEDYKIVTNQVDISKINHFLLYLISGIFTQDFKDTKVKFFSSKTSDSIFKELIRKE